MRTVGNQASGAIFSDDMKYRYRLWRCWDPARPRALFILLNPSTADSVNNDPTIERQQRRVMQWSRFGLFRRNLLHIGEFKGFGAIEVVNACAWRSTDPAALYEVDDPIGDDNGEHIHDACTEAVKSGGIIVCGWGTHAAKLYFGKYTVDELLRESLLDGLTLHALKLNSDGTPAHPLYLGYDLKPRRWADGELHEEVV